MPCSKNKVCAFLVILHIQIQRVYYWRPFQGPQCSQRSHAVQPWTPSRKIPPVDEPCEVDCTRLNSYQSHVPVPRGIVGTCQDSESWMRGNEGATRSVGWKETWIANSRDYFHYMNHWFFLLFCCSKYTQIASVCPLSLFFSVVHKRKCRIKHWKTPNYMARLLTRHRSCRKHHPPVGQMAVLRILSVGN